MSTPISITADKDLVCALQRPICSLVENHPVAEFTEPRADTFCGSNSENWPVAPVDGGHEQVQLDYPETGGVEHSYLGTEYFCADYLRWLGSIAPTGPHTHEPVSYLREIDPSGENADRYVDGMEKLSDFCRSVEEARGDEDDEAGQTIPASGQNPPPPPPTQTPPATSPWEDFVSFLDENTTAVVATLTAVGGLLSAAAIAVRKFQAGLTKLVGAFVALENIANIFSSKKENLQLGRGEVLDQLRAEAPEFFKGLEREVENYVSDLAIERFEAQRPITQRIHIYLDKEGRPPHSLPWGYARAFAKNMLTAKNREILRDEAALRIAAKIDAQLDEGKIVDQLVVKKASLKNESREIKHALYLSAVVFWRTQLEEDRIASIDLTRVFRYGELPQNIIDLALTDENIELARRAAAAMTPRSNGGNGSGGATPAGGSTVTGLVEPNETSSGGASGTPQGTLHRIASSLRVFWGARAPQVSHRAFLGARAFALAPVRVAPPTSFRVSVR